MPARQQYRLRARSDREIIHEAQPGKRYVDHDTGEELRVVSAVLPLAPSPSSLPYSIENLRLCGCSLEQLVQKDLNDCPHCGRRLPAVERQSSSPSGSPSQQPAAAATASQPTDPPSHQS